MTTNIKQPLPTRVFPFTWFFLKKHPGFILVSILTSIIWSAEISISPYLLKIIIDGVNNNANTPMLLWSAISIPVIIYASISLIMNITFRIWGYAGLRLFPELREKAVSAIYFYLCQHSYRYFQEHFSGTLAHKLGDISNGIEHVIQIPNTVFIPRMLAVFFAVGMLMLVQPIFAAVLLIWLIIFVSTTIIYAKYTEEAALDFSESTTQFGGQMNDGITNIITTKIFANEKFEYQRILKGLHNITAKDRKMQWRMQISHFIQGIMVFFLMVAMLYFLIQQRLLGNVTVGDFAFVLSLSVMFTFQIWDLGQQFVNFTKERSRCQQALNVLLLPHEIPDKKHAKAIPIEHGLIEFRAVKFNYKSDRGLFDGLSVTIQPGEKVGLVGYSGGGKSSFIRLIMRLYEVEGGQILIDGHKIEAFTKENLRAQIAMIPQEPEMFHRTILENICYGRLNATEAEVI
nr:ABC transporter ATP-binding protein/permease [Pseudomonadota bacterium]